MHYHPVGQAPSALLLCPKGMAPQPAACRATRNLNIGLNHLTVARECPWLTWLTLYAAGNVLGLSRQRRRAATILATYVQY